MRLHQQAQKMERPPTGMGVEYEKPIFGMCGVGKWKARIRPVCVEYEKSIVGMCGGNEKPSGRYAHGM